MDIVADSECLSPSPGLTRKSVLATISGCLTVGDMDEVRGRHRAVLRGPIQLCPAPGGGN